MKNRYRQGYLAELELVRELKAREEFHTVLRSAGSRSSFDVVAFGETRILVCQVKTGNRSYRSAIEHMRSLEVPACVTRQLRIYRNKSWTTIDIS